MASHCVASIVFRCALDHCSIPTASSHFSWLRSFAVVSITPPEPTTPGRWSNGDAAYAQKDNLHTPGHFVLDGCAPEDPTYLEFWNDEAGNAHVQHHEMESYGINLIDMHTCGGAPVITLNRCRKSYFSGGIE